MMRPRGCGLRGFAVLNTALIAQLAAFAGLCLAFGRFAVLIGLFLDKAGCFLDLSFNAHCGTPWFMFGIRYGIPPAPVCSASPTAPKGLNDRRAPIAGLCKE